MPDSASTSTFQIRQVKNYVDTSLRAHLAAKGAMCSCCGQLQDLCRCVTRANAVKKVFEPMALRDNG
jgi:hypothetical protein